MKIKPVLAIVSAAFCGVLSARDLTWCGGAEGEFTSAANWVDSEGANYAPQPGDALLFGAIADVAKIKLTGSFDLGEAGISFQYGTTEVASYVRFSGAGGISVTGTGPLEKQFSFCVPSTYTGGLVVNRGTTFITRSGNDTNIRGCGEGPVTVHAGNGARLYLSSASIGGPDAPVTFVGCNGTQHSIFSSNESNIEGPVTGDDNINICNGWGALFLKGGISVAPGKTVFFDSNGLESYGNRTCNLFGNIDCNISFKGYKGARVHIFGTSLNPENTIAIDNNETPEMGGYVSFESTARWAGRMITMNGPLFRLKLSSPFNLASDSTVSLINGAKIQFDEISCCGTLLVDGAEKPSGRYTSADCGDAIEGMGVLLAGTTPAIWTGSAEGLWSDGANWSGYVAPKNGDLAVFQHSGNNEVTYTLLSEEFDIGEKGISIYTSSKAYVTQGVSFTGAGGYAKYGDGTIHYEADSSYLGQTIICGGKVNNSNNTLRKIWGENPVVRMIVSSSGKYPCMNAMTWGTTIPYTLKYEGQAVDAQDPCLIITNPTHIHYNIEADSDIYIRSNWGPLYLHGKLLAPGKTVTYYERKEDDKYNFWGEFMDEVNASIVKKEAGRLMLSGVSPNPANSLYAQQGIVRLAETARWGGTDVRVGPTGTLELLHNENLSADAEIVVEQGGKIKIGEGIRCKPLSLTVNGVALPTGRYSQANLPDVIEGDGRIVIGTVGMIFVIR